MNHLYHLLGFDPQKHSVKVEVMAGTTTFLTMTYILAVNPLILSDAGMDKGALFSATVISSVIATLVMALYARLPYALAPSMGLNAFFAYTLVLAMGYTWQQALTAVFFEGIAFIILTLLRVREAIVEAIPINLRYAISVGIGLFIAYIGLKNGGIIVGNEVTMTSLGKWNATTIIAAGGILLGGVLMSRNIKGALFYTIIAMTIIGIPFGVTQLPENFSIISAPQSMESIAFKLDFSRFLSLDLNYYVVVFALLFMDLFNTLGTLIGTATSAGMVDKETGKIQGLNKALMADAVGTAAGALCGTSTVTTYVESSAGVMEGGRTGMTSLTVAILFLIALFFSPLFLIIPAAATTSALVIVGVLMIKCIKDIDFSDVTEALPVFVTIISMPLTYSISDGIVLGMLSYVIIKVCSGRYKEPSIAMYILSAFFVLNYVVN
ncbi:MAG: NCS2 family permease [Prevotella sp.]|nr:NCS2 family permease [Prevotella sp.]